MADAKKKTFLIVDGHALLHRAWHALPPLTTKDGLVVHGAYGFTMIMLSAIKRFAPAYVAVTFDLKGPTFRHDEYEEYKATREKKPDELYAQVPILEKILMAMGIPVFVAPGFEADDVIGTLSRLATAASPDVEVMIATGDMDTLQLVDKRTKVFTLRKGFSDTVVYDEAAVKERYGFKPAQLIDYKALRGDPSDNIPGVRGIGEKTGSELIATFGSIEALYESLKKDDKKARALKAGVREKLIAHEKEARQAKRLCTIVRDVKLDFSLSDCAYKPADRTAVEPVFKELEFMKLLKQFPGMSGATPVDDSPVGTASMFGATVSGSSSAAISDSGGPALVSTSGDAETDMRIIADVAALDAALSKIGKAAPVAFRTVTLKDDAVTPDIAALVLSDGKRVVAVRQSLLKAAAPLLNAFLSKKERKICHDLKRELHCFRAAGLDATAIAGSFDLMIASYLLASGERRHSLGSILAYDRAVPLEDEPEDADGRTALAARQLRHFGPLEAEFSAALQKNSLTTLYDDLEAPLVAVLARMEEDGIAVDAPYLKKLSKDLGGKIDKLVASIHKAAGEEFNVNSPAQLKVVLFDKLGVSSLGLKRTGKTKELSTAAAELEKLRDAHPIVAQILDYRELAKLKSTYVDALPELVNPATGRIHAEFNQTVAATGRLSSSNPNLQNIPTSETEYGRKVRDAFVAPRGRTFVAADYSQFELRIAAHIAHEKHMIAAFKAGEDIHWRTAAEMFGEKEAASHRRIAKVINFGILYGMGPQRLAESAGISFMEAREYIERYFAIHQGIAKYMEDIKERIADDGFVETLFGRKRFFRNVRLMNPRERAEAERQAINMPIQGSQADMIKRAMLALDRLVSTEYAGRARMVSQVHDELLFEVETGSLDEFIKDMEPLMTGVADLVVPITVNVAVGERWGSLEKRA